MNRNPNGLGPRTMRDCTFQDWADPIEKHQCGDAALSLGIFFALVIVAGACVLLWGYAV